jgi:hypothetical protein
MLAISSERGDEMNLKDIKEIAQKWGVKAGKMKKNEIIRAIQRAEGNFDCFGEKTV